MELNTKFSTKNDYEQALLALCEPLKSYFSEGRAYLKIGPTQAHYEDRIAGLETFSRLLWGLVPFFKGGGSSDLETYYKEGLSHGTDPEHPEYWGTCYGCHQAFVEMAAIGLGLLIAPEKIWEPLSEKERNNLNDWLLQINPISNSSQ